MSKTFEEIWCHKEIMGSKNANALWRAGQKIAQEADAALAAKDAEIAKLREELEGARNVIEELVTLKDMKLHHFKPDGWNSIAVARDYERRQPAAWEQARALLARKEAP